MSARGSAAPPVLGASADIHVTGRRIVATIVDGLVFGGLYALMAVLFGTSTIPALPTVAYALIIVLYYILMERYLGQTLGKMLLRIKVLQEDNGEVPGLGPRP